MTTPESAPPPQPAAPAPAPAAGGGSPGAPDRGPTGGGPPGGPGGRPGGFGGGPPGGPGGRPGGFDPPEDLAGGQAASAEGHQAARADDLQDAADHVPVVEAADDDMDRAGGCVPSR